MLTEGDVAVDIESEEDKKVLVKEAHPNTRCDEKWTGQYGYDMEKRMVADYEKNAGYPDDDTVTTVFYIDSLERAEISWEEIDINQIITLAEEENIKSYDLPSSRLQVVTESSP